MRLRKYAPVSVALVFLLTGLAVLVGLLADGSRFYTWQKFAAGEIAPRFSGRLPKYVPGEVIVKRVGQLPRVENVPVGAEEAQARILDARGDIEYAEPNFLFFPQMIRIPPNDARYDEQWYLDQVQAEDAWQLVRQAGVEKAVSVALIDTGVDCNHLDLQGPCYGDDNDLTGSLHGTNVAGMIAALTNNGLGISSLSWAWGRLESINVCEDIAGQVGCPADKIAAGIRQANAPIINISLGGTTDSRTVREAIYEAYNRGKLLVAAAGNTGDTTYVYPAAYPQVMAVAGSNSHNGRATDSSYGVHVDVAAPGEAVLTTCEGGYCQMGGTSLAAGLVSGLAALVWGQDQTLKATRVRSIIQDTADAADYVYFGRINAAEALARVVPLPTPTPTPTPTLVPTATPANFPPQGGEGPNPTSPFISPTPFPIHNPSVTKAATFNPPTGECEELSNQGLSVLTNPHCAFLELQNLVVLFLKIAFPFAAIAALAFILMGGFFYVTAGDNPDKSETARATLTWAIIGLVITLSAWIIMKLVVGAFGNIPSLSLVSDVNAQVSADLGYELNLSVDRNQAQANGEEKIVFQARLSRIATPTPTPELFGPLGSQPLSIVGRKVTFSLTGEGANLQQLDAVTNSQGLARAELSATVAGKKIVKVTIGELFAKQEVVFTPAVSVQGVDLAKSTVTVRPSVVRICGENPLMNQTDPCGGGITDPTVARIKVHLLNQAGEVVNNVVPEIRVSGRMNQLIGNQLTSNYAERKQISVWVGGLMLKHTAAVEFVSAIADAPGAVQDAVLDLTQPTTEPFEMFAHKQILGLKVNQPETVDYIVVEFNCRFNGRGLSHGRFIVQPPPNEEGLFSKAVDWMAMGGPADPTTDSPSNGKCELTTQIFRRGVATSQEPNPEPQPEPPDTRPVEPIDPFGVVTSAKDGQVLVGARVTLYEWDEKAQNWQFWSGAKHNNQANPQQTDTFGQYSFLVDPGKYSLTVEKENFRVYHSKVIQVVDEPVREDVQLVPKTPIWTYLLVGGVGLFLLILVGSLVKRWRKRRALKSLGETETGQ